jgi:hypothetical protein
MNHGQNTISSWVRTKMRTVCVAFILILGSVTIAFAKPVPQVRSTPSLELLHSAQFADARSLDGRSFQLLGKARLQHGKGMETEGTYQLVWASPTQWREVFSFPDFNQTRVGGDGGIWEERKPSYLSLRMWQIMQALNFYGRLELPREESAIRVKVKKRDGMSYRCIEIVRNVSSIPIRELCFRGDAPQLASEHYVPSDRTYEFSDYVPVGTKFFPGHVRVYDGKTLAADFSVVKVEEMANVSSEMFEKSTNAEWRAWCASPESGGDPLTPIYSRQVRGNGESTFYGTIGPDGLWHGLFVLNSARAHDSDILSALKMERWKPTSCQGVPIAVDTVFKR